MNEKNKTPKFEVWQNTNSRRGPILARFSEKSLAKTWVNSQGYVIYRYGAYHLDPSVNREDSVYCTIEPIVPVPFDPEPLTPEELKKREISRFASAAVIAALLPQ